MPNLFIKIEKLPKNNDRVKYSVKQKNINFSGLAYYFKIKFTNYSMLCNLDDKGNLKYIRNRYKKEERMQCWVKMGKIIFFIYKN